MNAGTWTAVASIVVALIAAASAEASRRAAGNARAKDEAAQVARTNQDRRQDALDQAYDRAREFDVATIARQDRELAEALQRVSDLEGRMAELTAEVRGLRAENSHLRRQLDERT